MARRKKLTEVEQQTVTGTDPLFEGMNPEQSSAIRHITGPLRVLAGAGSGKTRVLIHRVAYLVRSGVAPERVLAVTFSKNAADEMKERGKKLGLDAEFRTWHSLALHILKEDETEWAKWKIDDTDRARYLLKDILGYKAMNWKQADIGVLSSYIGYCKANLWSPDSTEAVEYASALGLPQQQAHECFVRYQIALEENELLTFDDFLVLCVEHLHRPGVAERWAAKWDYLLQDEAQDANPAQLAIAKLLATHQNYMVVGDPAQAIYSFRGSAPQFIINFDQEWGGETVTMHRNYRCGRTIIDVANSVIRPSTHRLPSDISAEGGWDGVVTWRDPETLEDEGAEVVGSIKEHTSTGSALRDNVVLYRLNAQSRGIEEALLSEQIPYVVVGGVTFYERKEVRDLLSYLRLIDGRAVKESLRRSLNAPFRFLGAAYLEKVLGCLNGSQTCDAAIAAVMKACSLANVQYRQKNSAQEFCSLLRNARDSAESEESKPDTILQYILDKTGYEEWLRHDSGEESLENSHVANVKEIVRVAARFGSVKELLDFVDSTIESAKRNKDNSSGKDRVVLMSIHKSKGLEFKHVHFVGACEMIIPHPRAEDIDEERRLAYVAITRAKQTLLITSPRHIATKSGMKEVTPSRFIVEAGLCGGVE